MLRLTRRLLNHVHLVERRLVLAQLTPDSLLAVLLAAGLGFSGKVTVLTAAHAPLRSDLGKS